MSKFFVKASVLTVGVASIFALTGCSLSEATSTLASLFPPSQPVPAAPDFYTGTVVEPVQPAAVPAEVATAPVTSEPTFGDVITSSQVTDEYGTYLSTVVDPASPAMKFDSSVVENSSYEAGFTDGQILSAQQFAVSFVASEGTNSVALDRDEIGWEEWKNSDRPEIYLNEPQAEELLSNVDLGGYDRSALILNDNKNLVPVTVRDGGSRVSNSNIVITSISGHSNGTLSWLSVDGIANVTYRVPGVGSVQDSSSGLVSGEETSFTVQYNWSYALVSDGFDSWKIGGYNNNYTSSLDKNVLGY